MLNRQLPSIQEYDEYFKKLTNQKQLGFGLYTTKKIEHYHAKQKFLAAIASKAPQCLEGFKNIFKEHESLFRSFFSSFHTGENVDIKSFENYEDESKQLNEELSLWIQKWHIDARWILEDALEVLQTWIIDPDKQERELWYTELSEGDDLIKEALEQIYLMLKDEDYPNPPFYVPFIDKSKHDFKKIVDEYIIQTELMYEKHGFVKTMQKKEPQRDFEWLVEYLLLEKSPEEISQEYINSKESPDTDTSPKAVLTAVRRTANLVRINI